MRELKITGCKDSSMWYAGLVGQRVPLLREEGDVYLSREPAGYTNIVRKADACIVDNGAEPIGILSRAEGQKAIGTNDQLTIDRERLDQLMVFYDVSDVLSLVAQLANDVSILQQRLRPFLREPHPVARARA